MSSSKNYSPELIFDFKKTNKLTPELNEYLISIKKCMESCTDSKDFKIKLKKYDIKLSSTKWYRKRFVTYEEKIKKTINSLLNKLTDKNYKEITVSVLKIKVDNFQLLEYLCKNIIDKCLLESQYLKNWSYLIEKVFSSNLTKWNFDDTYLYKIFLDICQKKLEKIIRSDYHNKLIELYDKDIDLFYKLKNKTCNFVLLLGELKITDILSDDTVTSIVSTFISEKENFYEVELGILITEHLIDTNFGNNLFNKKIKKLMEDENLNKRNKFMIMDILDKKSNVTYRPKVKSEFTTDEEIEVKIKNIIDEFLIEKDYDYVLTCYKEIQCKPKSNKVIYEFILNLIESDTSRFNEIFLILKKLLKDKSIKYNNIKFGLIDFLKEYDDLILDYPNLDKQIIKIFNVFIKMKVIEFSTLKFIFNKGLSDKEKNSSFMKKLNVQKK